MNKKFETRVINEEILAKLSLKNRYHFINDNLRTVLRDNQFSFLKQVQEFCINYEKNNNITHGPEEDVYNWYPDFGKEGYITRQHPYEAIDLNYKDLDGMHP